MSGARIFVVSGQDDILRSRVRVELVAEHVGDADASLVVTELVGDDWEMRELVDAAQTPPFLTEHRVVIGRDMERLKAKEHLAPLLAYLEDPLPTTVLIIEWSAGGAVPKALVTAVEAAGGSKIGTGPGRQIADFVKAAFQKTDLHPDRPTIARVTDWVGEDAAKVTGLLPLLVSTFGPGARLTVDEVEPFLGDAGGIPPWDLTDAIDKGDIAGSLVAVHRQLGAGKHPLQILASLHSHFQKIMRLDGAAVRSEKEAAVLLGLKGSTFPAKKALNQSRKLGSVGVSQSIGLLAATDLDLKGATQLPNEVAMELLVARLARVARAAR